MNKSLSHYNSLGFKLFYCKPDKSPKVHWTKAESHISVEEATKWTKKGGYIGARPPENILVLDVDNHRGKSEGLESLSKIINASGLSRGDFIGGTMITKTPNGYHFFYLINTNDEDSKHVIGQCTGILPGIDIRTNKGYVIAPPSPGYVLQSLEITNLQKTVNDYLKSMKKDFLGNPTIGKSSTGGRQEKVKSDIIKDTEVLDRILYVANPYHYRDTLKWQKFCWSLVETFGSGWDVYSKLINWSRLDIKYSDEDEYPNSNYIKCFDKSNGGVTLGSTIYNLRDTINLIGGVITLAKRANNLKSLKETKQ